MANARSDSDPHRSYSPTCHVAILPALVLVTAPFRTCPSHAITPMPRLLRQRCLSCAGMPIFTWDTAPRCLSDPIDTTSTPDTMGRLWGFEAGMSCAFRDLLGRPLKAWANAPRWVRGAQRALGSDARSHLAMRVCACELPACPKPVCACCTRRCDGLPVLQMAVPDSQGR